jgi:O-antigen ligase
LPPELSSIIFAMFLDYLRVIKTDRTAIFCIGLAAVFLAFIIPFPSAWNTFIHGWRVEVIAAVFILSFILYSHAAGDRLLHFAPTERNFIILPMVAMIAWCGLSVFWSGSTTAALQHTLTWCLYLIFYLIAKRILQDPRSASRSLTTIAICLAIFALLAVFAQITLVFVGKSTQIGIIYSKFGEQSITVLPLILIGVLRSEGRRFLFGVAGTSLLWLLIFCSSSRASIGLFLLSIFLFAAAVITIRRYKQYRLKLAIVCLPLVLLPLLLFGMSTISSKGEILVSSRIKNSGDIQASNDFRLLMYKLSYEMFAQNPVLGVGAGNFGLEVNRYRLAYSKGNPADQLLAQAETTIPERTHNEYLQILSELGIVGALIFGWFLVGIGLIVWRSLRNIRSAPPQALAAAMGLVLFLASSLVTSYSFRLVQNGITFFFILAVASRLLIREAPVERATENIPRVAFSLASAAACLVLIALCGIRVSSAHLTHRGNSTEDLAAAATYYETAMALDHNNPDAPYALGRRLIENRRYSEAISYLRHSINIGKATSTDYSYLATAQTLAGDNTGAEATFREAVIMYPRSTFVRTRYAALLQMNEKYDEAAVQFAKAQEIDLASANAWRALITQGAKQATALSQKRTDHTPVMDLHPYQSIYAVIEERGIRNPDERVKLPF